MSARGFRWDWLTFGKNILSMAARDCRLPRRDPRKPQKPHARYGAHHRRLFMQPIPFTPEELKAQGFTFAEPDDE